MKYFYIEIEERNGEYEYRHKVVRSCPLNVNPDKFFDDNLAGSWYGGEVDKEDDGYYYNGGEVFVELTRVEEITKEEFDILNKYL